MEGAAIGMTHRSLSVAWAVPLELTVGLTVPIVGALLCGGCGGIGPSTINHDRFDYTEAISASWKQQMLANIVKLRYGDTPQRIDT